MNKIESAIKFWLFVTVLLYVMVTRAEEDLYLGAEICKTDSDCTVRGQVCEGYSPGYWFDKPTLAFPDASPESPVIIPAKLGHCDEVK